MRPRLRIEVVLLALVLLPLLACGASARPQGLSLRIDRDPFRLTLLQNGRILVRETKAPNRLRYQLASTGEQFALTKVLSQKGNTYRVGTNEKGRTASVTIKRTKQGYRISTRIEPAADVQQVFDAFDTTATQHFLGAGERTGMVDLRGRVVPVYVSPQCSYAPVPFFASSGGWGLRLEGENVAGFAFPDSKGGVGCDLPPPYCSFPPLGERVDVCMKGNTLVEDLYAGSFDRVLAAYQTQTGPAQVPPPAELASIKWRGRTVFGSPNDLFDDIRQFRAAGIPLGWVLLDDVWQTCMGTLEWKPDEFPNPAGLVRRVHAQGVKFMLWVSPKAVCGTYPRSQLLGPANNTVVDLTNPTAVAAFKDRLRALVALGIDGVKGDRGDEVELESTSPSLQNAYPLLLAKTVESVLRPRSGVIFRAATVGSQHVLPGIWAGDQDGTWEGLRQAIRSGATAGASGFPTWGSDIGGFRSQNLTGDVFARWTQLGAVSPIFEVGGAGPNSTPWVFGAEPMAALKDAAILHYELFPYLYGLLQHHRAVLRPLAWGYPNDPKAWSAELELLVGPDLLAVPVARPGTRAHVYLPKGTWIDLYSGEVVSGGRSLVRETPLTQFPLYLRTSAVVPFNLRTASASWWAVDELTHAGRAGFMAANGTELQLRGQPRNVQIFVPAPKRPKKVTLGGSRVAWAWNAGPLPGVVVRLHGPAVTGRIRLGG